MAVTCWSLPKRAAEDAGAHPGDCTEFQGVETIKHCVRAGLDLAPLPRMPVAAGLRAGTLVASHCDGPPLRISSHLVWNPARHLNAAERAFFDHVREEVKPLPVA